MTDKKRGPIGRLETTHPALQNVPSPTEDRYPIRERLVDINMAGIEKRILDNYKQARKGISNRDK